MFEPQGVCKVCKVFAVEWLSVVGAKNPRDSEFCEDLVESRLNSSVSGLVISEDQQLSSSR